MSENATVPLQGAAIAYGTVGGSPTTAFGKIDEIPGFPELSADEYDKTRINQSDLFKQFAPSLADGGTFQVDIAFVKADIAANLAFFQITKAWLITFFDTSSLAFNGWLKKCKFKGNKGDEVVFSCEIRVSGGHTFTPAS